LDIARVVASAPAVRADVARYDAAPLTESPGLKKELAAGQLQGIASLVQHRTSVMFVAIVNKQGIRLAH
jgi:two-component system, CitB family, sensor kinase